MTERPARADVAPSGAPDAAPDAATITVGVPVYNGEAMLEECLASLAAQTFPHFTVLIFDNASSDATGDIARRWVQRDPRFTYFRQAENRGAKQNFLDVLAAARTPYFLWRAYDDLSDPQYLETLHAAITSRPGVKLAAPLVVSQNLDSSNRRVRALPPLTASPSLIAIARRLFGSHASWFYGLWEREALVHAMETAWREYPSDWASDHLALFPLLVDGVVAPAPGARFIQRIKRTRAGPRQGMTIRASEMADLRRRFMAFCLDHVQRGDHPPLRRLGLRLLVRVYTGKRVYSLRKLARLYWREWRAKGKAGGKAGG